MTMTEDEIRDFFQEHREELMGERVSFPAKVDGEVSDHMKRYYTFKGIGDEALKIYWDHTSKYKWGGMTWMRYEDLAEALEEGSYTREKFIEKCKEMVENE